MFAVQKLMENKSVIIAWKLGLELAEGRCHNICFTRLECHSSLKSATEEQTLNKHCCTCVCASHFTSTECAIQVTLSGAFFFTSYTNTDVPCHISFTRLYPECLNKKSETSTNKKKQGLWFISQSGIYIKHMSCKHRRVFPVWVHQEAGEGAVCLGAGVKSIVLWQSHLDPHLVARDEVEQGAARQRPRFGPVAVELKIRCHCVCVLHQVKLEAGAVDRGVDGKVVNSWDFAGETPRLWVVVTLFVDYDLVKVDCIAYSEG